MLEKSISFEGNNECKGNGEDYYSEQEIEKEEVISEEHSEEIEIMSILYNKDKEIKLKKENLEKVRVLIEKKKRIIK